MSTFKAMTVAGSDSGGGAGIQADMKAFAAHGVYGTSAITALTAQNTLGVQQVFPVSPEFVAAQIDSIMDDIGAHAWKTGMLANDAIIEAVAERARHYGVERLVVDPVMVAKGGASLLDPAARDALIGVLLPLAYVATPNIPEAEVLTGMDIVSVDDMKEAARRIHRQGAANVVVKGGHLDPAEPAIDVIFDGDSFDELSADRVDTANTHGTGCTFAAAIAARLALGHNLTESVAGAKKYLTGAIRHGARMHVGGGHGPVDHFFQFKDKAGP